MSRDSVFHGLMIAFCMILLVISTGCSASRYAARSTEDKGATTVVHIQTRRSRARIPRYEETEDARVITTQWPARPYGFERIESEPRHPCYPTKR